MTSGRRSKRPAGAGQNDQPYIMNKEDITKKTLQTKTNKSSEVNLKMSETQTTQLPATIGLTANIVKSTYTESFNLFWKAYPRKEGKGHAFKAFEKAIKKTDLNAILEAIASQVVERSTKEAFNVWSAPWKHPSTWLNAECWLNIPDSQEKIKIEGENKLKQTMSYREFARAQESSFYRQQASWEANGGIESGTLSPAAASMIAYKMKRGELVN